MQSLYQQDLAYIHAAAFGEVARGAAPEIVRLLQSAPLPKVGQAVPPAKFSTARFTNDSPPMRHTPLRPIPPLHSLFSSWDLRLPFSDWL